MDKNDAVTPRDPYDAVQIGGIRDILTNQELSEQLDPADVYEPTLNNMRADGICSLLLSVLCPYFVSKWFLTLNRSASKGYLRRRAAGIESDVGAVDWADIGTRKYGPNDLEILETLGAGSYGTVLKVRVLLRI